MPPEDLDAVPKEKKNLWDFPGGPVVKMPHS